MSHSFEYNRSRYVPTYLPGLEPLKSQIRAAKRVAINLDDPVLHDNIAEYFALGQDGKDWYDTTFQALREIFGGDENKTALFVDLLASTSPQMAVRYNIIKALFYLTALEEGWLGRLVEGFEAHFNNCCRSFCALPLSGRKVNNFQENLLGNPDAVTVDTWMMRAFGLRPIGEASDSNAPSRAEYDAVADAVTQFAYAYDVQPCQMQAALWVGIKRKYGAATDTDRPFQDVFREMKHFIDSQLTLGLDAAISNFASDGMAHQEELEHTAPPNWEGAAPPDPAGAISYSVPDVDVAINPTPKYGGHTVKTRLFNLVAAESTIDPIVIEFILTPGSLSPIDQMKAFYYLRANTVNFAQNNRLLTVNDVADGMHIYPVLQPVTPD